MRIALGTDHGGTSLKDALVKYLTDAGYSVKDCGCSGCDSVDYPEYGFPVAEGVSSGMYDRGIVICKSGIGMSIVANKVKGIRAALCLNAEMASSSRKHNNANVLVLPAMYLSDDDAMSIVSVWLETDFEGGRHQKRLDLITEYENRKI